jgi:hypothetical protein
MAQSPQADRHANGPLLFGPPGRQASHGPHEETHLQSTSVVQGGHTGGAAHRPPAHGQPPQLPQSSQLPVVAGLPPQCQPPLITPTPAFDFSTLPSSLTVPKPIDTNWPRS